MNNLEPLPEYYTTDDRQRIAAPTYEAIGQCQIIMVGENGMPGPTLVEPGEVFTTEAIPNDQWVPLNRAAEERMEAWLASLPSSGNGLTQDMITEAAYAMRPREGEPEIPHAQWWGAVLKYAAALKEKRQGNALRVPMPAMPHRAGGRPMPVMPFASQGSNLPLDAGRPGPQDAPQRVAGPGDARRARGQRPVSPLANTQSSESTVQTSG